MDFYEMCDAMDEAIHDYGKYLIPGLIFLAALVFFGLNYVATHDFPGGERAPIQQDVNP